LLLSVPSTLQLRHVDIILLTVPGVLLVSVIPIVSPVLLLPAAPPITTAVAVLARLRVADGVLLLLLVLPRQDHAVTLCSPVILNVLLTPIVLSNPTVTTAPIMDAYGALAMGALVIYILLLHFALAVFIIGTATIISEKSSQHG